MTINELLKKIMLPKFYYNSKFVISERYSVEADIFLSLVDKYKGEEFAVDKQERIEKQFLQVKQTAKSVVSSIQKIYSYYDSLELKDAQSEFESLMSILNSSLFISTIDDRVKIKCSDRFFATHLRITPGSHYYRIRPTSFKKEFISTNPDELFHIPYDKRALASNERFSLSGFPCLYLSTMLPLAWQECKYPSRYYYSEYQYEHSLNMTSSGNLNDDFLFLSLYSPQEIAFWGTSIKYNDFDLWLEVVSRYLMMYPLVLACSFVNQSGDTPFKQEYIIPQMLMQWVFRNSEKLQGIAYFTCTDLNNMTSRWCAYNLVIPALQPFDEKGYSKKLRERFCWTTPQFYESPLVNKESSEKDRECLNQFINDIRTCNWNGRIPSALDDHLNRILKLCCFFMSYLEHGDTLHMELAIKIINSIYDESHKLRAINIDKMIETAADTNEAKDSGVDRFKEVSASFKTLCEKFYEPKDATNTVVHMIEKYSSMAWNDLAPHSHITLYYLEDKEIYEPIRVLHDNHVLHYLVRLENNAEGVKTLKRISADAGVPLSTFWGEDVGDDNWMLQHFSSLKTPIIIRNNDVSILSDSETKMVEYLQAGFDSNLLSLLESRA